jgi:malate permease and related proteins
MILDNAAIVAGQVLILFLLMGVGYLIRKIRMLDDSSLRQVNNLLLVIITPCIIVFSFQKSFDPSLLSGILISLISAVATHVLGAAIAWLVFRKTPPAQSKVLQFAVIFSNCSFMCIPLLYALLGNNGVMYGSIYIAIFNIGTWTYGVVLMTGNRKDMNIRLALLNPGTVSLVIALPLYLLQLKLPEILLTVLGYLAAMNTPLAMIIIGAQLAMIPFLSMFRHKTVFAAASLRLLLVPVLMMLALSLFHLERTVLLACLIPAMAPVAASTTLFSTRYDQDAALATKTVALSTLLSIVTMPLLILCSDLLNGF